MNNKMDGFRETHKARITWRRRSSDGNGQGVAVSPWGEMVEEGVTVDRMRKVPDTLHCTSADPATKTHRS